MCFNMERRMILEASLRKIYTPFAHWFENMLEMNGQ